MELRAASSSFAALAAGVLLAIAAVAVAQNPPAAPATAPPLPPQYEVEILVFANREFDPSEERFAQQPNDLANAPVETLREVPVFDESTFGPLAQGAAPAPLTPPPADALTDTLSAPSLDLLAEVLRVRPLRRDELKLGKEYARLSAIPAYLPLLHSGWIQPGLPEADAQPFDLAVLGAVNPRGTVRVHLSRFLHITLDLTYQGADPVIDATSPAFGDALGELTLAPRYRLTATRSARSGELHYFDHPVFGVLVRVTPLPAPGANVPGRPAA